MLMTNSDHDDDHIGDNDNNDDDDDNDADEYDNYDDDDDDDDYGCQLKALSAAACTKHN